MILDRLENSHLYVGIHPLFPQAFEVLRMNTLADMALGKTALRGTDLTIAVSKDQGKARATARLEAHRRYIDIHYCMAGNEEIGWRGTATCGEPDGAYDPLKDFITFADPAESWVVLAPGSFMILFPGDAHAPMVSRGLVHKAVVKVAVTPGAG